MFLSDPGRTGYDLEFSIFGFPVRVHPAFFILPVLLGSNLIGGNVNMGVGMLLVIAIFFVSILVHELGHAVAFRYYRIPCRIVLYWMGGLAIPDSGNVWGKQQTGSLNPNQQIVVSLAGPVFGFLLAGVLVIVTYAIGGSVILNNLNAIPLPQPQLEGSLLATSDTASMVLFAGIALNIFLNVLNLVPIYPLDGGQIARQIMTQLDQFNGIRNSILLSVGCAALIAVFSLLNGSQFMAIFFGFMAWSNYQSLQQFSGGRW